jgi:hypothetical protein
MRMTLLIMVCDPFLLVCRCLRYMLAQPVCRRDPLSRRLDRICGKGPQLAWGKESAPAEARSGIWEGERASEGRRCFERRTLNADREANQKGVALVDGLSHWREL